EPTFRSPGQVRRVDWQAVAADAWSGLEAHETERLRRRRVDGTPDVDVEVVCEHRQLVHERNVDVAERILEQLGELGLLRTRRDPSTVDERVVERLHRLQ